MAIPWPNIVAARRPPITFPPLTSHLISNLEPFRQTVHTPAMSELPTYIFPAIQGLFGIVIAIVWAVGLFRHRNFGFLLLAFAALGECVAALVRQAVVNYIFYHEPHLSVTERSSTVAIVASVFLVIGIIFWLLIILGAILVVFRRSKAEATTEVRPPVSG